jgi:group II intron reverse transcriptase/maturase
MSTLLERALQLENMRLAWNEVEENKGVGGVDRVSLRAWGRNYEERLINLAGLVRGNQYKPRKLRLRKIPKRIPGEFRVLRIPTIDDRVLQRAFLHVLQPSFEKRFLDCSYGYRWKRSIRNAVQRILVIRENDYRWVLDADIDEFFNSVDHELLLKFLHRDVRDHSLMPLVKRWLTMGCMDPHRRVGIPLGSPLSPMWANVFLHRLDQVVVRERGWDMVRYADDFLVFARDQRELNDVYEAVGETLSKLRLQYEPSKTRLTNFEEGFDFVGVHFEGDQYSYEYQNKTIEVKGNEVDWLFGIYGPDEYE